MFGGHHNTILIRQSNSENSGKTRIVIRLLSARPPLQAWASSKTQHRRLEKRLRNRRKETNGIGPTELDMRGRH